MLHGRLYPLLRQRMRIISVVMSELLVRAKSTPIPARKYDKLAAIAEYTQAAIYSNADRISNRFIFIQLKLDTRLALALFNMRVSD
jgi:hypothetical protein